MTNIDKYIEYQGGILSGKLAEYIEKAENIGNSAARKRIERLQSPIHKLTGLFSDKQSFLYHSDKYNSQIYFEKLEEAFQISAKRCYAIIVAINYNHGIILKTDLPSYTFSPTTKIIGHLLYTTLIEKLIKVGVLIEYDDFHYCLNGYLADSIEPNFRHCKALEFTKKLILNQFSTWSKNIGLCSFNAGQLNNVVGGFQFAFTSPTYITGLVTYKNHKPNPGFLVADILIGNTTSKKEVDFFLQKISSIRASNPTIKLFPVLIVDNVDIHALNSLKEKGVLIATIREIFGESYNELLKNLINTITNAGAILKKDPENFIILMEKLTKLVDGKTNNLRGDLFEMAVGFYYGRLCQSLDIGLRIKIENDAKVREIDVLANYENEVRVVECKGYNYPVDKDYVEKYLSDKIPAVRKWLERVYPNKKQVFEIWSTGGFDVEATELLEKAKNNTRKYAVDYLDKTQILEKANQLKSNKFSEILKNYYFKEIV